MIYEKTKLDFERLIKRDRLSHAYLFFGGDEADRLEKLKFSQSLANLLEKGEFKIPAKPLTEMLLIAKNEEGTIGIDAVRKIKSFVFQKPIASNHRMVVVVDSEAMTQEAQNAVLKIVEEPPQGSLLIFIARNENNLFPTLFSRLQKIYFPANKDNPKIQNWKNFSLEEILENNQVNQFFEALIADLGKEPLKNFLKLKKTLRQMTVINQFNTNKKLQLKVLASSLRS